MHEPTSRLHPLQSWTPKKSTCALPPGPLETEIKAPAMGAPVKLAKEETPQDIPSRVPKRDKFGQILGKVAAGSVTKPAEKKPV